MGVVLWVFGDAGGCGGRTGVVLLPGGPAGLSAARLRRFGRDDRVVGGLGYIGRAFSPLFEAGLSVGLRPTLV